jgi:hypothetical protein
MMGNEDTKIYCQCGCGELAPIAKKNYPPLNIKKGDYRKYIKGHYGPTGPLSSNWHGGKSRAEKYPATMCKGHPRCDQYGYVTDSILVAEKSLGEYLPKNAVVHHVDNNPKNNNPDNLVVCENHKYHMLLHQRQRALEACGHAGWRKCKFCKEYDDPTNLYIIGSHVHHRKCAAKYERERRGKNE